MFESKNNRNAPTAGHNPPAAGHRSLILSVPLVVGMATKGTYLTPNVKDVLSASVFGEATVGETQSWSRSGQCGLKHSPMVKSLFSLDPNSAAEKR